MRFRDRFDSAARGLRRPRVSPFWCLGIILLSVSNTSAQATGPDPFRFPDRAARLRVLAKQELRPSTEAPLSIGQGDFDLGYSSLDIDVSDTSNRRIYGTVIHRITSRVPSLTSVALDLVTSMPVDSVKVNGVPATFSRSNNQVVITLASPLGMNQSATLRVVYHGQPQQNGIGLAFDSHNGKSFIWNLSEPDACRYWWPTKDHPDDKADSMDIRIVVPNWMTASSNGSLVSAVAVPPTKKAFSWHVSYPIAPYLVSVAAGDFVRLDSIYSIPGGGTMPLWHYVFPEQVAAGTEDFNIAAPAIDAFANRFGPYPFLREKYGISVFGWGGGMEHQTNTSYGYFLIDGFHSYDWIYVHELGHQWWGDNVTCATWADTWLNEGMASYCEAIWAESQGGASAYRSYMTNSQSVSDPSGPIYNYPDPFDGNTIYNKGAWVCHMLRGVLGDAAFFSAMLDYRATYQGRSVTTAQFQASLEASTGRELDLFFNEWVYGVDRPKYTLSTLTESIGAGSSSGGVRLYVHLDQTQTTGGFFTMPVPIRVQASGVHDYVLQNDVDHEDLIVDLPSTPTSVSVDPENWILRNTNSTSYHLNLLTTDLAASNIGIPVSIPLLAKGGTPAYSWTAVDATPPGTSLNPTTGVISGTPTTTGDYAFRIRVNDSASHNDTQKIRWTILPPAVDVANGDAPGIALGQILISPNPASGAVRMVLAAPAATLVAWSVYDLAGRRVISHLSDARPGQALEWMWNGRDAGGATLPSGVYFSRTEEQTTEGTRRSFGRFYLLR